MHSYHWILCYLSNSCSNNTHI